MAGDKKLTKEEEMLLQDFSRNVSTKSSVFFYGNSLIVSAIPICKLYQFILLALFVNVSHVIFTFTILNLQGCFVECIRWISFNRQFGLFLQLLPALCLLLLPTWSPSLCWSISAMSFYCFFFIFKLMIKTDLMKIIFR